MYLGLSVEPFTVLQFTQVIPPASVWRENTKWPKMLKNQSAVYPKDCSGITDFSLSRGLLGKSVIVSEQMKWETTEVGSAGYRNKVVVFFTLR